MGVTGLWKLIEQSGKAVPLDTLENKVLAIDISIWLHQVVKGFRDSNGATLPNAHLLGLFHRLCKLLYYRIKPVFVFDGGMPPLKRETIEKRIRNKSKLETEADKIQQLLLEALAKEKVVQQALGASTAALLASPTKSVITTTPKKREIEDEDLFKLPPLKEPMADENFNDSATHLSDISESDSSIEEKCHRTQYNVNLQHIDVTSKHFQSLPADIRHEILTDIKELRKQSSWGRLHEMPAESGSFSSFQMKRLLRRRRVQVELEGAEQEMGGKSLSLSELENLLSEKGIVDPDVAKNPIASNEHMRYVYVRDLKKAMEKSEMKEQKETKKDDTEAQTEPEAEAEAELPTIEENDPDVDLELQKAIHLSLQANDDYDYPNSTDSAEMELNLSIKMTHDQKKALGTTTSSLARGYMLEYGGLNDDQIKRMAETSQKNDSMLEELGFKYNDVIFIANKEAAEISATTSSTTTVTKETEAEKATETIELSDGSSEDVSSDADSDFVEVPDTDYIHTNLLLQGNRSLPIPFELNKPPMPDASKDFRIQDLKRKPPPLEIVVKTDALDSDDIFADIFATTKEDAVKPVISETIENETVIGEDVKKQSTDEAKTITESIEIMDDSEESTDILNEKSVDINFKPNETSSVASILQDLNKEMSSIKTLNLNSLLSDKITSDQDNKIKSNEKIDVSVILGKIHENQMELDDLKKNGEEIEKPQSSVETITNIDDLPPPKVPECFQVSPEKKEDEKPDIILPKKDVATVQIKRAESPTPSTSHAIDIIDERQVLENAANILRERNTTEELEVMAQELNQDRLDLYSEMKKNERMASTITERMTQECMELLKLFGVPYMVAPMEAEAQCAFLDFISLTDGTITDDSDIWLFGGQTVYKNFFDQNKLVLEFKLSNIKSLFHLDRKEMVQLAFLVGSDYTTGIHGIGSVTALEILSVFSSNTDKNNDSAVIKSTLSTLRQFRDWLQNSNNATKSAALRKKLKNVSIGADFPSERVAEAYLFPQVDESKEIFTWGKLDPESIREYTKKVFGWTKNKTDEILKPVLRRLSDKTQQQSIKNYFKIQSTPTRQTIKVSDRVRKALDKLSNEANDDCIMEVDEAEATTEQAKKPTKRQTRKTKKIETDSEVPEKKSKTVKKSTARNTKKKAKEPEEAIDLTENDTAEASTSNAAVSEKKICLPDPKQPIPQRERDKEIMEANKLKAIEILKNAKKEKKSL